MTREELKAVAGVLKQRFKNLTAEETIDLASDILVAIQDAKPQTSQSIQEATRAQRS